ncbi:MAG: 2,3-bisphosphoglycerate-independent phosphoglycerate mutase [Planctomycetes bacterium]|nr:2,3-bisphosphoglycerate-independent phosphoglycerate mutase [Planctomycetota bacterium]
MRTPHAIIVLDGFGISEAVDGNAIRAASTPHFDRIFGRYPHTRIAAHGTDVGLMPGLMGNSEVGHMNIGAGRVVAQDIDRINATVAEGSFFANPAFLAVIEAVRDRGSRLHLMGLLSDGGVHSSDYHYQALIELAARHGLSGDRCVFHAFLDGRDTPPRSAERYLRELEATMTTHGAGLIGTVVGRYWAMDRDRRWERVQIAYDALVRGDGQRAGSALEALGAAYDAGEDDEFVKPRIIAGAPRIQRGDGIIMFNFRADRVRQLTEAFMVKDFAGFAVESDLDLAYATMTEYKEGYPVQVAFEKIDLELVFGELAEREGLSQLRIAETEKYAHVTFFFNGGKEEPFKGEERILIPSPKVATYDLQPEMSAPLVTEKVLDAVAAGAHDLMIMNFANADMVGHTGKFDAAVKAVEAVDRAVGAIAEAIIGRGGGILLTADHGNIEQMWDPKTNQAHTAHTTNPVPLVLIDERFRAGRLDPRGGRLADVIPTLLDVMGIAKPAVMNGRSLLERR